MHLSDATTSPPHRGNAVNLANFSVRLEINIQYSILQSGRSNHYTRCTGAGERPLRTDLDIRAVLSVCFFLW